MRDQEARLHEEAERLKWRVANGQMYTKEIEGHYRGRFVRALKAKGILVAVMGANEPFDLIIGGHACELKVARARAKDHKKEVYQALMYDPGNRHRLNGSFVIVLCVDPEDHLWPYIIPRAAVGKRRTVEITSHPSRYAGQWRPYLGAFDYFGDH